MRIKGPGDGPRPTDAVDEAGEVEATDGAASADAVSSVGGTSGPGGNDPISQIAARFRNGELTSEQAVDLLIEDAIQRQLGGTVPKDMEAKLREVLREHATSYPYLAAKIRRLTKAE
jgi:hypothetical protein